MADLTREEKLTAGLRKLKQFQQRSNRKSAQGVRKTQPPTNSPDISAGISQVVVGDTSSGITSKITTSDKTIPTAVPEQDSPTKSISASSPSLYNRENPVKDIPKVDQKSTSADKAKSDLNLTNTSELSSKESILQISQQINGLMSETHAFLNGGIAEGEVIQSNNNNESQLLAQRNQELASQIDRLRQSNDHLQFQIQEAKAKVTRHQREFENERQLMLEKSHKEQVALKDQLQVHIQTIGILVAEKTELQSSLSLSQQTAKQKAAEIEEFQGRLRASRQRANDLERELNTVSSSSQQFEKVSKESSKDVDRLKIDNYKLGKSAEELRQQNAELSEKVSKKVEELQALEKELGDTRSKLSLSELYAQQLSSGAIPESSSQVEELHHEKLDLEKKVQLHKDSIDKLIVERDQMSEQYQVYIQQLSQQVTSLRDELQQVNVEKEVLVKDKNVLVEKLEVFQQTQESLSQSNVENLKLQMSTLEKKNEDVKKELETQVLDNAQLSNLVTEQESRIMELESSLQRMKEDEIDKSRLFNSIQSEKVAASRAVSQNMELKKQLAELQNGFITMSNDKLELTEKLMAEQHITKELGERLSQQEDELKELKDQVSVREEELQNMHVSNTKGIYQQSQIADRMRHYEAQGQLADTLQQELKQAKERNDILVNQNTDLRMALALQVEASVTTDSSKEDKDTTKKTDLLAALSASVQQLEMERNQMMKQLEEQKHSRTKLEEQIRNKENNIGHIDNDVISRDEHDSMKKAMQLLEERFKKTMDEIVELSDEKQRLEHLVLQLQGETETIGDYIALYQIQRSLMRKRASEKDEYIVQLAKDREDLKTKLSELQGLMMQLLEDRKHYQTEGVVAIDSSTEMYINAISEHDIVSPSLPSPMEDNNNSSSSSIVTNHRSSSPDNTAKKIMNLLSEIETTNLIDKPVMDNFHPCALCSGRLITV